MGDGHLKEIRPGVWRIHIFVGRDPKTRKQRFVTKTVHGTKEEAIQERHRMLVAVDQGQHDYAPGTFGELANRWYDAFGREHSDPQWVRRRLDGTILLALGDKKLSRLQTKDIDLFYGDLRRRLRPASVRRLHAIVRSICAQGVVWKSLPSNPAAGAKPPKVPPTEIVPPTTAQVRRLIDTLEESDPDTACYLRLAATTGGRRGELCALRWRDVQDDELVVRSTKTDTVRRVKLDPGTVTALGRHRKQAAARALAVGAPLAGDRWLFSYDAASRRPWNPSAITHRFIRHRERLGLTGVRLHDLRHYMATDALINGTDVRTVAGRGGWANATTLLRTYAAFIPAADQAAAEGLGTRLDQPAPKRARRKSS